MKHITNFFKKYKVELLSFFVPIFIFFLSTAVSKIFPFGTNILSSYDGIAQYPGFTLHLSRFLHGQESILYSFEGALGYNFFATFVYYLANPTNILSVFATESNVIYYYMFIIYLRIGLSGLTMSKLLKYKNKNGKQIYLFSIAYALMAYNVLYFYNYMYFDTIVLFPLVIIGLEKLIHENKSTMYVITLSLSILSNFYIGYMVCIFCLIYFIYKYLLLEKEKRDKKIIFKFILYSVLSAAICSVFLFPVIYEILNGKISMFDKNNTYTQYWKFTNDALKSIYRMSIGAYSNGQMSKTEPNIYCSMFVFVLFIMFLFNKKISKKEKILSLAIIGIYLLCFSFNFLDYAWHMFQRPVWYPKRYSFTLSLFLILLAYKNYNNLDTSIGTIKKIIIVVVTVLLIVGSAFISGAFESLGKQIFLILSIITILEYFLVYDKKYYLLFLLFVFFLDISANTIYSIKNISFSKTTTAYNINIGAYKSYMKAIDKEENNNTNEFYRVGFANPLNANTGAHFNYNGIGFFSSLRNGKLMTFAKNIEFQVSDGCNLKYHPQNIIYNTIFGIKYITGKLKDHIYKLIYKESSSKVFKNEEAFSLGYMVNKKLLNITTVPEKWIFNTNEIVNNMADTKKDYITQLTYTKLENGKINIIQKNKYIEKIDYSKSIIMKYEGVAKKDMYLFLPISAYSYVFSYISINGEEVQRFNDTYQHAFLINKGDKYNFELSVNSSNFLSTKYDPCIIYKEDYDLFVNSINNQLEITKYEKDDHIEGKINVTSDKTLLFFSIPYDEGWHLKVDGKKHNYTIALDAFIAVELEPGIHTIELNYMPKGLIEGCIISSVAIVITTLLLVNEKKKRKVNV